MGDEYASKAEHSRSGDTRDVSAACRGGGMTSRRQFLAGLTSLVGAGAVAKSARGDMFVPGAPAGAAVPDVPPRSVMVSDIKSVDRDFWADTNVAITHGNHAFEVTSDVVDALNWYRHGGPDISINIVDEMHAIAARELGVANSVKAAAVAHVEGGLVDYDTPDGFRGLGTR